ncbi:hypothetical protein ACQ4PT_043141 [Festuca glaucescens]
MNSTHNNTKKTAEPSSRPAGPVHRPPYPSREPPRPPRPSPLDAHPLPPPLLPVVDVPFPDPLPPLHQLLHTDDRERRRPGLVSWWWSRPVLMDSTGVPYWDEFEVEEAVAMESDTIRHMLEDDYAGNRIPLIRHPAVQIAKLLRHPAFQVTKLLRHTARARRGPQELGREVRHGRLGHPI